MKFNTIILILSCFLFSTPLKAQMRKIAFDSIPNSILSNAKILAFDAFKFQQSKRLDKFLAEHANLHLNKVYDFKKNNDYSELIHNFYGKLIKVVLQEVLVDKKFNYTLRFRGYYEKTDDISEIRVRTNSQFKFSEFSFFNWYYDKYYENAQEVPLEKLNIDSLTKTNVDRAFELAEKSWKGKEENYLKLTSENATPRMMHLFTKETLTQYRSKIYTDCGPLLSITLAEVLSDGYRTIYRYKAEYELIENFLEIVVVTNFENKFYGMTLLPE